MQDALFDIVYTGGYRHKTDTGNSIYSLKFSSPTIMIEIFLRSLRDRRSNALPKPVVRNNIQCRVLSENGSIIVLTRISPVGPGPS